jgi:hypothetical protein
MTSLQRELSNKCLAKKFKANLSSNWSLEIASHLRLLVDSIVAVAVIKLPGSLGSLLFRRKQATFFKSLCFLWKRGLSPFVLDSFLDLDLSKSGSAMERQSLSKFHALWGSFCA